MKLTVAHRTRAKLGEDANGDGVVIRREGDAAFVAVIDGLGHGEVAHAATAQAVTHLKTAPFAGVKALLEGAHRAMRGTRGAAITACMLRGANLEGCGVGNVELRALGTRVPAVLTPGIVGAHHSALRVFRATLNAGDRVALFSDGLDRALALDGVRDRPLESACHHLFESLAKPDDDATLLLVEVHA